MNLKEAVKDTNKKFLNVAEYIPKAIMEFLLVALFILILRISYPIAIIIRLLKK